MAELVCRLDPARFTVHVVCFRKEGPWLQRVAEHAASVTELPLRSLKPPSLARAIASLARWLRAHEIAALHAWDIYANIVGLPAARLAAVPLRIGSRRGIVSPVPVRGMLALQRLSYAAAHLIVANSAAAAARLRRERVPRDRIAIVPNGIDLTGFDARPRRGGQVVTTVANLRRGKGHDVLLRAAAEVLRRHPGVRFGLVGDGPLKPALEAEAHRLGVAANVDFLGHRDDVGAVLASAGICAFPSLMEAFPNAVMEAMAAGLPIVATETGGIPELIESGRNGLLVAPGDAGALAAALVRLLDEPAVGEAYGRAARQTIESYSFDRMVAAFESLYAQGAPAPDGQVGSELPIRSSLRP